jgi:hypothetical protein
MQAGIGGLRHGIRPPCGCDRLRIRFADNNVNIWS